MGIRVAVLGLLFVLASSFATNENVTLSLSYTNYEPQRISSREETATTTSRPIARAGYSDAELFEFFRQNKSPELWAPQQRKVNVVQLTLEFMVDLLYDLVSNDVSFVALKSLVKDVPDKTRSKILFILQYLENCQNSTLEHPKTTDYTVERTIGFIEGFYYALGDIVNCTVHGSSEKMKEKVLDKLDKIVKYKRKAVTTESVPEIVTSTTSEPVSTEGPHSITITSPSVPTSTEAATTLKIETESPTTEGSTSESTTMTPTTLPPVTEATVKTTTLEPTTEVPTEAEPIATTVMSSSTEGATSTEPTTEEIVTTTFEAETAAPTEVPTTIAPIVETSTIGSFSAPFTTSAPESTTENVPNICDDCVNELADHFIKKCSKKYKDVQKIMDCAENGGMKVIMTILWKYLDYKYENGTSTASPDLTTEQTEFSTLCIPTPQRNCSHHSMTRKPTTTESHSTVIEPTTMAPTTLLPTTEETTTVTSTEAATSTELPTTSPEPTTMAPTTLQPTTEEIVTTLEPKTDAPTELPTTITTTTEGSTTEGQSISTTVSAPESTTMYEPLICKDCVEDLADHYIGICKNSTSDNVRQCTENKVITAFQRVLQKVIKSKVIKGTSTAIPEPSSTKIPDVTTLKTEMTTADKGDVFSSVTHPPGTTQGSSTTEEIFVTTVAGPTESSTSGKSLICDDCVKELSVHFIKECKKISSTKEDMRDCAYYNAMELFANVLGKAIDENLNDMSDNKTVLK